MARRKKRKVSRRRSSRRMGAVKGQMMEIVGIAAGAAAAGFLSTDKILPNINGKIKSAAIIGIGAFLMPKVLKGAMGQALGNGMIAVGSVNLLKEFNVLGAIGDYMNVPVEIGAIEDNLSVISGTDSVMAGDDIAVLAGSDEEYDY